MPQVLEERELTLEGPVDRATNGRKCRSIKVNVAESPLSWLHARGHIDDRLFLAGEKLRADWECAQLAPVVTMQWNPVRLNRDSCRDLTAGERQIAARRRFDSAIEAAGSSLSDILWRVVCAGEGLPVAERALGWPVRSGKLVLGIALDRVAQYYRIR